MNGEYKFTYTDNLGQDETYVFEKEEDAARYICIIMERKYEALCEQYPDEDVTWLNRLLDCGDITEIYIPNTNVYGKIQMFW